MDSIQVKQVRLTQHTYKTTLRILDEPANYQFSSTVLARDSTLNARVLVKVSGYSGSIFASAQVGDEITAQGTLSELNQFSSYRKWEHIVGEFHVENIYAQTSQPFIHERLAQVFRNRVIDGCSILETDNKGVCEALLIGEKNNISRDIYAKYRNAQLTHLLVASGANIAFLVGFITPLIRNRSSNTRAMILMSIAIFYCVVTRFEPSILRACMMVIIPQLFVIRGIKRQSYELFIIAVVLCLFLDPFLIFRVGFWLSVGATAGLVFLSRPIMSVIRSQLVSQTLASTICVQPILWLVFGFRWPSLWWISVIAVAIAEPLTTMGMIVVISISFLPKHWIICSLMSFPLNITIHILNILASFSTNVTAHIIGIACNLVVVFAYAYKKKTTKKKDELSRGATQYILYYR